MQPEYGMLIGWFSCPTRDCNNEWDKHWIADIYFMDKVHFENPHYSAFLNGTLLIKKVLPMYDERYFIMRVRTGTGDEPNIYHLKIVQERPVLTLVSQQNIYAFEGMDVFLEAQVKAYPYPRVSLSRVLESNESVIQEASNVSSQILMKIPSITNADSGDYVLYTENTVGNDTVTVRVNVEEDYYTLKTMAEVSAVFFLHSGIPGRLSSPPPDTPTSLSSSGPGYIPSSEAPNLIDPPPLDGGSKYMKVTTALAIIIPLALICIGLLLKIICCKTCNCHLNRSQLYNFKDRNIAGTRSCKGDTEASANSVRYVNNSTAGHACSL
ncbi:uncharacterized protein LOC113676585 isoform X1 [Pocillopora damicornis]|uniref:uncharacterized protein LOC113676585 isoform X1 n=1 Tax=Pocillopora damicornis TaxID=46731 RepID=UPI000F55955A|nr:uncharacterized protein LOC113676585 isoform X1 [Pocillopora damicornis]